jgi:xanthine dehydrogenase accessory factor
MMDIYREIAKAIAEGESVALATVVLATAGSPRKEGTKMLIRKDGSTMGTVGGGGVEAQVRQEALEVMGEGKPRLLHFGLAGEEGEQRGMICGGRMDVFIEPIVAQPTLYLFGAGHISLPVAKIGKLLGFRVVVVDQDPESADPGRFPEADMILVEQWEQLFPKLQMDDSSYIVILTGNHITDQGVLEWALGTGARYIGMVGSKSKREAMFSHLSAKGVADKSLNRVHFPIGLEIQAETPEEIAVSILAQIIKIRRAS